MPLQAYSGVGDLLTGDIPLSSNVGAEKYVQDAADEIDSHLGFIYQTPLDLTNAARPVKLLVKRINNFLASGRYIMAVASPIEQAQLHAYGHSLVEAAQASLKQIVDGEIRLDGVPRIEGSGEPESTGPLIANVDPESQVEAFYDRIANPNYGVVYSSPYGGTGWIG